MSFACFVLPWRKGRYAFDSKTRLGFLARTTFSQNALLSLFFLEKCIYCAEFCNGHNLRPSDLSEIAAIICFCALLPYAIVPSYLLFRHIRHQRLTYSLLLPRNESSLALNVIYLLLFERPEVQNDNEHVNSSQLQCKCCYECLASLQTLDMQVLQNTNKIFARRTGRTQQTKRHKWN